MYSTNELLSAEAAYRRDRLRAAYRPESAAERHARREREAWRRPKLSRRGRHLTIAREHAGPATH